MPLNSLEGWGLLFLALCNVGQFWYWSRQIQTLIDKVMSKTYAEYVQTQKKATDKSVKIQLPLGDEPSEDEVLGTLNGMLGPRP